MADVKGLSALFSPFHLKGLTLPNRFIMPAMQRQWCEDGKPLQKLTDYYVERIRGGVSLIITESCAVDHPSSTANPLYARMAEGTLAAWRRTVEQVKGAGGHFLMQLWHEGAIRTESDAASPTLSPSGLICAGRPNGRAASVSELDEIRRAYVRSAQMAQAAGFDGVEIHAAHGFLLDQFLWPATNRRNDQYGGSLEARVRFPAEIVAAVREATGPAFLVTIRLSQWKEADYQARVADNPEELRVLLHNLRQAGVDAFHASARRFWTPEWEGSDAGIAGWVKRLTDAPVIAVGSVGLNVDVMESFFGAQAEATGATGLGELARRFGEGEFDLVAVGRGLIGDPEWVAKVRDGHFADLRMFAKRDLLGDYDITDFNQDAVAH